jgi:nickel/cobalt transporter (NicO) family protein
MTNTADLIQHSSLIWLMASGLLLGGLHALEPGHSKTLIASFVVATRGSVPQAVLLGLSAALSHSFLIWVLAGAGLYFGNAFIGDDVEPWLQLGAGVVVVGIGVAMAWRQGSARGQRAPKGPQGGVLVDTGHGWVEITIFEQVAPPCFQLFFYDARMRPQDPTPGSGATLRTLRSDGAQQVFAFAPAGLCLNSTTEIPEPHEFRAILSVSHDGHIHQYRVMFTENEHHSHDHQHPHHDGHEHGPGGYSTKHEAAHARQIEQGLSGTQVTTGQIALFGVSSGLMPCPAALAMLLVCLRLKKVALGIALVASFSLGLAVMMVGLGIVASIGVRHAARHLPGFGRAADYLPFASGAIIVAVGIFMGISGYRNLS